MLLMHSTKKKGNWFLVLSSTYSYLLFKNDFNEKKTN
jgi:hypothetical protein